MSRYVVVTFAAVDAPSQEGARAVGTRVVQALRYAASERGAVVGAVYAGVVEGELAEVVAGLRALASIDTADG